MTHKAVGIETGTIYATGTHQQCVRAVNERISNTGQVDGIGRAVTLQQTEAIRIYRAGQQFETDAEYLERMEKEMRLLEIQAEQRKQEKAEQRKRERIQQREMEAKVRREQQEELRRLKAEQLRRLKAEQKRRERVEIARVEAEQKATERAEREARKLEREAQTALAQANKKQQQPKWSPEEEAYLRTNMYEDAETLIHAIWERFGRRLNYNSLNTKKSVLRRKYGMQTAHEHKWTEEDDAYIIANYNRMTGEQIGAHIGKKKQAVWVRVRKLKDAGLMEDERHNKKEETE